MLSTKNSPELNGYIVGYFLIKVAKLSVEGLSVKLKWRFTNLLMNLSLSSFYKSRK